MVVSGSVTSHRAGRACGARASAGTAARASETPNAASAGRRRVFSIKFPPLGESSHPLLRAPSLTSTCPFPAHPPKPRLEPRDLSLEPELPGPDPNAPPLLGRARLRHPPALRHGDGGGDFPPADGAARAGTRSVARGLCPAVPPPDRRPLW